MIFRYCFCCFGSNQNPPTDPKRFLANQSTSNANKHRDTVPKLTGNYEATLSAERPNLTGSTPNLTGSKIYLAGSSTNLAKSSTNLAGSQTNIFFSGQQFIHSSPKLQNETETANDLEESIARTPQASHKPDHWGKDHLKSKQEMLKTPAFLQIVTTASKLLPTITVGSSSPIRMSSSENTSSPGIGGLSKYEREIKSLSSSPKTSSGWLKSQSMLDVTCTSYTDGNQCSRSTDNLAQRYGLDTSLYENTHLSKSMEAVNRVWKSMDDLVNENVFIDLPNGALHFIPSYSSNTKKLIIKLEKIEGLAPKGINRSKYDCIIKLTLLPHEKHVRLSKIIDAHCTLNLEESFTFSVKDPTDKVLRMSVYDTKFLGKYDAVGHALFYVIDALTHEQKSHALKLYRQTMPDIQAGSIKIVLNYNKQTELLNVFIDEAYNLPILSGKKSYLKLTQYSLGRKMKEIYSPNIRATKQFGYKFTVDLTIDSKAMQNSYIVVCVKMRTFLKDMLVGRVILGPFFHSEYGKVLTPWGRVFISREKVSYIFRLYQ